MLLKSNPEQARHRVSQTFFEMLDHALPDHPRPDATFADVLSRARALQEAVFVAVLHEYGASDHSAPLLDGDEYCVRSGAD